MMTQEGQTATLEGSNSAHVESVPLQTFKLSYTQILAGADPWIPLGNFMHQFFGYYKQYRAELVHEPLEAPENLSPEHFQWAVFCAASVEHLCKKYEIPCPNWALDPRYTLEEPWYYDMNADLPEVQEDLRQTTPEEFSRRNIFCGDRTYRNKYEYKGRQGRRKTA